MAVRGLPKSLCNVPVFCLIVQVQPERQELGSGRCDDDDDDDWKIADWHTKHRSTQAKQYFPINIDNFFIYNHAVLGKPICCLPSATDPTKRGSVGRNYLLDCNSLLYVMKSIEYLRAQGLSGRVLDSRPRGRRFEPHRRHCVVVLEQDTFIQA